MSARRPRRARAADAPVRSVTRSTRYAAKSSRDGVLASVTSAFALGTRERAPVGERDLAADLVERVAQLARDEVERVGAGRVRIAPGVGRVQLAPGIAVGRVVRREPLGARRRRCSRRRARTPRASCRRPRARARPGSTAPTPRRRSGSRPRAPSARSRSWHARSRAGSALARRGSARRRQPITLSTALWRPTSSRVARSSPSASTERGARAARRSRKTGCAAREPRGQVGDRRRRDRRARRHAAGAAAGPPRRARAAEPAARRGERLRCGRGAPCSSASGRSSRTSTTFARSGSSGWRRKTTLVDLARRGDHALAREHAEHEVGVGAGRPHGHEPAPAVQVDLERLLDRERIADRGRLRCPGRHTPHLRRNGRLGRCLAGDGGTGHRGNDSNAALDVTTEERARRYRSSARARQSASAAANSAGVLTLRKLTPSGSSG